MNRASDMKKNFSKKGEARKSALKQHKVRDDDDESREMQKYEKIPELQQQYIKRINWDAQIKCPQIPLGILMRICGGSVFMFHIQRSLT